MAYAETHNSRQKIVTVSVVAGLHVVLGYVLVTGLAATGLINEIPTVFQARNIEVPVPPPPKQEVKAQPETASVVHATVITPAFQLDQQRVALPELDAIVPSIPEPRVVPPAVQPETALFQPEAARPRNNPGAWVTESDYPTQAVRLGLEGVARFTVTIGGDGRVSSCQITGSSGHDELDAATCRLVTKRARFEPARDNKGAVTSGSYSSAVRWKISN